MSALFDGFTERDSLPDWCAQVSALERRYYGEGNNRSALLLQELCAVNGKGFVFALRDGVVIGTADFWEVSQELYDGILHDTIPEEHLPVSLILKHDALDHERTGLWYLASFIVDPQYVSNSLGAHRLSAKMRQFVCSRIINDNKAYPMKLLSVASSENGMRLMYLAGMREVETKTEKKRYEGALVHFGLGVR